MRAKRWLITGGCGFIGRSLVKNLVDEGGHYIRIIDNLSVGTPADLARVCEFTPFESIPNHSETLIPGIDLVEGDILDEGLALQAARGMDVIVHLAANTGVPPSIENPRSDCLNNVVGTFNYLEAARTHKVGRFVFASSGAPIGECEPPIHEELAPHPVSPYGASKLAGEGYCSAYFRTFGLETVALRFGNVYGPLSGHKNSVVAKFIKLAMEGQTLEIYGDGNQTRDFIFIGDLVNAIRLAATREKVGGETFQIATNSETTVNELTEKLKKALNQNGIADVDVRFSAPRLGDVLRNYSDTSKARKMLGWQAECDLKQGLNQTIEWFLNNFSNT